MIIRNQSESTPAADYKGKGEESVWYGKAYTIANNAKLGEGKDQGYFSCQTRVSIQQEHYPI